MANNFEKENTDLLELYGYVDKKFQSKNDNKPKTITLKMIITRNLNTDKRADFQAEYAGKFDLDDQLITSNDGNSDETNDRFEMKAKQLLKLTHIHLDREQIGEIDNLAEYLGSDVTNLYLQSNLIKQIENLEFLNKLKFLTLQNNQISKIENLSTLTQLKLLDLSHNLINEINVKELPKNLSFLDLRENECLTGSNQTWIKYNYSDLIKNYLKDLKQLNGEHLEATDTSDDDDDDDENASNTDENNTTLDTFQTLSERIVERSKQRQVKDASKMDEISEQRKIRIEQARQSIDQNIKFIIKK
jgi:hypothetical protein